MFLASTFARSYWKLAGLKSCWHLPAKRDYECFLRTQDGVVVDYSMPEIDGRLVASRIKKTDPRVPVIMLSRHPAAADGVSDCVDAFVDKSQDPSVLVSTVESLVKLRSHSHPELEKDYVVFVDASEQVPILFEEYVRQGKLEGQYILEHKQGHPIFIKYHAFVFPDGCKAAVWEPTTGWKNLYQGALLELEGDKLKPKVEAASAAIHQRIQELQTSGGRDAEEWSELHDALSSIKVLRQEFRS
jgi:CheY-like chemotaxis protein